MKTKTWIVAAAVMTAASGWGASITLDWDAVTSNADSSVFANPASPTSAELSGYRLFYRTTPINLSTSAAMSDGTVTKVDLTGTATTYVLNNLADGTSFYIRLTARDVSGNQSGWSAQSDGVTDLEVLVFTPPPTPPPAPVLNAPSAVSATRIDVSWNNVSGETSYRLERSLDNFASAPQVATVTAANATSFPDTGRSPSTQYYYRVFAVNLGGDSPASNVGNATTPALPTNPPADPSNLGTAANSSTQITVSWTDNSTDEETFEIVYSLTSGMASPTTVPVTSANPGGTGAASQPVTGLTAGTTYFFKIRAVNPAGASALVPATAVSRMTRPAAPSTPTVPSVSSHTVTISWGNVTGETGFQIERSLSSGTGYSPLAQVAANVTSYQDPNVQPNTYYYYRVYAFNGSGNSGTTAEVYARTSAGTGLGGFTPPPGLKEAYCYPNPAVGRDPVIRAMMGSVDAVEVTIFDQSGRTVHSGRTTYSTTVNGEQAYEYTWTGEKAPGVYYAVIHGKKGEETIRARAKFAVVR